MYQKTVYTVTGYIFIYKKRERLSEHKNRYNSRLKSGETYRLKKKISFLNLLFRIKILFENQCITVTLFTEYYLIRYSQDKIASQTRNEREFTIVSSTLEGKKNVDSIYRT